jgi:anthranilate phosphoribosyltransferase
MNYAAIIKQVGRGREGARAVTADEARELFGDMLDGRVPELHLGALLLAYRIKGDSVAELRGFLDAVAARAASIVAPAGPLPVVIPSYNGAKTMPNLVPLLALSLARLGIPVLVHGTSRDATRVTTAQVFAALGVGACGDRAAVQASLAGERLAFVTVDTLLPGLGRLIDLRWTLGVRNSAHTVVKMIQPFAQPAVQLVSVTHPEYLAGMREYFTVHPANVLLLRGTQGEAVANARRAQAIEWLHAGRCETVVAAEEGSVLDVPTLPAIDAASTASWTGAVLAGDAAMPPPIARQIDLIAALAAGASPVSQAAA